MRLVRTVGVVTGACALTAIAVASAGADGHPSAAVRVAPAPAAESYAVQAEPAPAGGPGVAHAGRRTSAPPTTAFCEQNYHVACYQPGQVEAAYGLPALYQGGVQGQSTTIAVIDSFGSPTIGHDLAVFDRESKLPAPSSLKIIQPAGQVPAFSPASAQMVGWAAETTLDVEYAHAIAPRASILLVETPVAESEGETGFPQIVQADNYVINHGLAGVISQSFGATEQTFPSAKALVPLRSAFRNAELRHVTVLSAAGDAGAADVGPDGQTYYPHPVTSWPASDPLVTAVGGTQLHLNSVSFVQRGTRHTVTGYGARPGYDLASGVGTIDAEYFVPELAALGKYW